MYKTKTCIRKIVITAREPGYASYDKYRHMGNMGKIDNIANSGVK